MHDTLPQDRLHPDMPFDPVLIVLALSTLAALIAAAGVLPFRGGRRVPPSYLGRADALASGFMIAVGYLLLAAGLDRGTLSVVGGAGLGVVYTYWLHRYSGAKHHEPGSGVAEVGPGEAYRILLLNALHSASEGVAIGVAWVVDVKVGIFMTLALALHNVAEAMAMTGVLLGRSAGPAAAAGLSVVVKVPQILLAVVAYSVVSAAAATLPWMLGFAAGALFYLVLTELLPTSYEVAGEKDHAKVAWLVSTSAGMVVLLEALLV
jgi:zinc transporter ZupT